ncbi:MAG: di-trans,poly-cis-decaprenylcistransferase [Candidatus Omnitrophica bacterium 4484_70.1]|nr:MAG: di-trans,poly-cis-decaprenylcistransferase [Candidatus Omnitrophica bacterium 4484_70.1]
MERVKGVIREAKSLGIKILTLFAFSTENWSRPKQEVEFLFSYLRNFLRKEREKLVKDGIRLRVIGRRDRIGKVLLKEIDEVEEVTKNNSDLIVNIALDYGGRWEIVEAIRRLVRDVVEKRVEVTQIDEKLWREYLYLNVSDPDLLIRTSGEMRISNFLLWQLAYTELYFPEVLWPDFDEEEFRKAIEEYGRRERRFGKVKEE